MASLLPGDHQIEAVELGCKALHENDRAQVIMACGTGKTLVGYNIARNLKAKKILILVPSLALISQTLLAWTSFGHESATKTICVCSDADFSEAATADPTQDTAIAGVTTDKEAISSFIEENSHECVVLCTYHSSFLLSDSLPPGFEFDLAIFDEAHRTAGHAKKSFSLLLKDHKNITLSKRLFLTATPKQILVEENDSSKYFSMDDEEVYGQVAYRLSLREAIERDIICDYEILISVMPTDTDSKLTHDDNYLPSINAIELEKAMVAVNAKKAFTFHSRVSEAATFSRITNSVSSNIKAFHVNGKMPRSEREQQLQDFINCDKSVISNAKCLSEGVDLPTVDLVGLMSPRDSAIDIVQIIGRALRKAPGKKVGYIFLPIRLALNEGEELSQAMARTNMDHVWNVIKSLSDQDEEISFQFSAARREYNSSGVIGNYSLFDKLQIQAPVEIRNHFRQLLEIQIVKRFSESWEINLNRVKDYFEKHNKYPHRSSSLGKWLNVQRTQYKRKALRPDRIERFKEAGLSLRPHADAWENGYKELFRYKMENGNVNVPPRYTTKSGFRLGKWLADSLYRPISIKRKLKLLALGVVPRRLSDQWEKNFNLAKKYLEEFQGQEIKRSRNESETHNKVARWLDYQKCCYQKGSLSASQIKRLSELGVNLEK